MDCEKKLYKYCEKKKKKRSFIAIKKKKIIDQNDMLRKEHVIIHPVVSKYA